jgi:hypothetical protein
MHYYNRDGKPALDDSVDGRRVRLVHTDDEHTTLVPGSLGTARFINNYGDGSTLFVQWDDGSGLGLIDGVDKWAWLDEEEELIPVGEQTFTVYSAYISGDHHTPCLVLELKSVGEFDVRTLQPLAGKMVKIVPLPE